MHRRSVIGVAATLLASIHILVGLVTAVVILLLAFTPFTAGASDSPPESLLLSQLRELDPLPKVHYCWPLPFDKLSNDLLYEYVRLTHAVSLSGEWCKAENLDRSVVVCKRVNATTPRIPASIGINYSVWHRRFGKDLPPTDTGPTHKAELDYMKTRLETIRKILKESNKKHATNIAITAILFDSERFHIRAGDSAWNDAITAKYNAAYDLAKEIFPDVRIEWYARGAVQPGASSTGWGESAYFPLKEKGETFACSLYQVPEIGITRETFRRTAENAAKHGCEEVTPWIALASGYRRKTHKFAEFSLEWNYDLIYSWQLGAEINCPWFGVPERHQRFAPWNKAKIAVFYPEPFGRPPRWGQHFVAYVRGAHVIKSLPDHSSIDDKKHNK